MLRLKWKHIYVKMCIQNLSWAPATASTRQSPCWIQRAFRGCWEERCVTHMTTPLVLDWLERSPVIFIPFGFPSDTEKRQRIFCLLSRTVTHCSYVPHRDRISNSSSSESKNRSNLSESEKSAMVGREKGVINYISQKENVLKVFTHKYGL